jgi:hypothetical protein
MSTSAKPPVPTNEGLTDLDRGQKGMLPTGNMMTPRGRQETVKGPLAMEENDGSADALHRRVPGRGTALNGLSEG